MARRPIHCDNHSQADYDCEACLARFRHKPTGRKPKEIPLFSWYTEVREQPCTDCGVLYPPEVMEFDHVPGRGKKLYNIGQFKYEPMTQKIKDELAKCDVVCANCHRMRTHSRRRGKWGPKA